jgi:phosphoglycerate dehydrogenase-like enzyme
MNKSHILYLGPADLVEFVRGQLSDFVVEFAFNPEEVDAVIDKCVGVLDASMRIRFDKNRINRAILLRVYATATTGATHVDQTTLQSREIQLLTLQGQSDFLRNITPAAELSWMLLMMCARQVRPALQHVLDGKWDRTQFPGHMLNGRSIGIIGCGRIGQWMAQYATAFGMSVSGFDPGIKDWPKSIRRLELDELLSQSDFLSLHVSFSESLRMMIDSGKIRQMKRGAIFINTSRGELVDEQALITAIIEGRLGGLGVDVLTGEPEISNHPLIELARTHSNVVITPHIGGFSPDALSRVIEFSCQRLKLALREVDK